MFSHDGEANVRVEKDEAQAIIEAQESDNTPISTPIPTAVPIPPVPTPAPTIPSAESTLKICFSCSESAYIKSQAELDASLLLVADKTNKLFQFEVYGTADNTLDVSALKDSLLKVVGKSSAKLILSSTDIPKSLYFTDAKVEFTLNPVVQYLEMSNSVLSFGESSAVLKADSLITDLKSLMGAKKVEVDLIFDIIGAIPADFEFPEFKFTSNTIITIPSEITKATIGPDYVILSSSDIKNGTFTGFGKIVVAKTKYFAITGSKTALKSNELPPIDIRMDSNSELVVGGEFAQQGTPSLKLITLGECELKYTAPNVPMAYTANATIKVGFETLKNIDVSTVGDANLTIATKGEVTKVVISATGITLTNSDGVSVTAEIPQAKNGMMRLLNENKNSELQISFNATEGKDIPAIDFVLGERTKTKFVGDWADVNLSVIVETTNVQVTGDSTSVPSSIKFQGTDGTSYSASQLTLITQTPSSETIGNTLVWIVAIVVGLIVIAMILFLTPIGGYLGLPVFVPFDDCNKNDEMETDFDKLPNQDLDL